MKLTITSRLTLTTALLTLLLFVPSGLGLYFSVASVIRREGARRAEEAARNLAFNAFYEIDNNLMVKFKAGVEPLRLDTVQSSDWALVRGSGRVVQQRGRVLAERPEYATPGASRLFESTGSSYRVASVPLLRIAPETFSSLPEAVRECVRRESPDGVFLRAERSSDKGRAVIEVDLLEEYFIRELEISYDGALVEADTKNYSTELPPDLADAIARESGLNATTIRSWKAYRGQLIAMVSGRDQRGNERSLAFNRLGERFLQDQEGEIAGPAPDSRLWLVAATDASAERSAGGRLRLTLGLGLPLLWAAVVLIGWYVTRRAMSPVNRIVDAVRHIEVSRLDERLPVGPVEDELHRISTTINGMLDRLEDGYRRETQFTGDASHELRGPLAKVIADIDVALSRERPTEEYRATLERCHKYATSMERLVDSLLRLARLDSSNDAQDKRTFELTDLVAETTRVLPPDDARRVLLEVGEHAMMAYGTPGLIRVLLQNLLQNALRHSPPERKVVVRLTGADDFVRVEVEDEGEGIPVDELPRVASRFYRVDKSRARETGGFGLGLAIANEIALSQGTKVQLENRPEGGLRASFKLSTNPPHGCG